MKAAAATFALCMALFTGNVATLALAQGAYDSVIKEIPKLRQKAKEGDSYAQHELGDLYFAGLGVEKNDLEAMKWWRLAAKQGNSLSQFQLGNARYYGWGVLPNYEKAAKWFRLAAEQKHVEARYNLAKMLEEGRGITQNYKEAVKWYLLLAEQGHIRAQYNLGLMYAEGKGVPQDYREAYIWFSLAAVNPFADDYNLREPSAKNRQKAGEKLTLKEINFAQKEAEKRLNAARSK